jgi:hypothetical protein
VTSLRAATVDSDTSADELAIGQLYARPKRQRMGSDTGGQPALRNGRSVLDSREKSTSMSLNSDESPLQTILLLRLRHESGNVQDCRARICVELALESQDDAEYQFIFGEKQRFFDETGRGSIFAELEFNMGAVYTQAVMWCLEAGPDVTHGVDDGDFDDALDIQENTLAIFRQLLEVV